MEGAGSSTWPEDIPFGKRPMLGVREKGKTRVDCSRGGLRSLREMQVEESRAEWATLVDVGEERRDVRVTAGR